MPKSLSTITGAVESANNKGIKIDGTWYNYSKFNKVTEPNRGDNVQVQLDGQFIQQLTVTGAAPKAGGSTASGSAGASREVSIVRQVAVKSAAAYAAAAGLSLDEMLQAAETFETWINRTDAPESAEDEDLPF